ncbi:MAG: hypothetical protein ACXIVQ_15975 [Acidimicrobiales bacterium]
MTVASVPPSPVTAGPRLRTTARVVGSVFAVIVLAGTGFSLLNTIAYEHFSVDTSYTGTQLARVESVVLDNSGGGGEIRGTSQAGASLTTTGTDGLISSRHDSRVAGSVLHVDGSCRGTIGTRCRVHQSAAVPSHLSVEARVRHGDLTVADIAGPVAVDTLFGRVDLTDLSGPLELRHGFGLLQAQGLRSTDVDATHQFGQMTLAFVEAPTSVRVDSRFGQTIVEVPDDGTAYRVTGTIEFGERTVSVRTDPDSERTIHVDHQFGDVTIRYTR